MSKKPLKLSAPRVKRTYVGGKLLDEWKGNPGPEDNYQPEEWIASVVTSNRPDVPDNTEGLSFFEDGGKTVSLKAYIEADPEGVLGKGHFRKFGKAAGVLTKVLDSAERLIIQVHPTKEKAKKLFNSDYGKTEAWYILGGRKINGEEPYVLFGFKPGITEEKWRKLFQDQDIRGQEEALQRFEVKPGEVMLIQGGVPHAIGPGCLILEIQEPTDLTIRTERKSPSGLPITDFQCHQGAGFDRMFDCFEYQGYTKEEIRGRWHLEPKLLAKTQDFEASRLIGVEDTRYFGLERLLVRGKASIPSRPAFHALVVLKGKGSLAWASGSLQVRQGDQLFVPADSGDLRVEAEAGSEVEIVKCLPPS